MSYYLADLIAAIKDGRKIDAIRNLRDFVKLYETSDERKVLGIKAAKDLVEAVADLMHKPVEDSDTDYAVLCRYYDHSQDLQTDYIVGDSREWCIDYIRNHFVPQHKPNDIVFVHVVKVTDRAKEVRTFTI